MFQRHDASQPPQGGLIHGHRFTRPKLLRALGDNPQAGGDTAIVCTGAAKGLDQFHYTVKVARLALHQRSRGQLVEIGQGAIKRPQMEDATQRRRTFSTDRQLTGPGRQFSGVGYDLDRFAQCG